MDKTKLKTVLVPPDGGWGWIVCLSYALCNIVIIPIMQSFGLIFRLTFADLGMSMADSAFIINTNSAFGMLMGLVNGSILKRYGYRKGAVAGGLMVSVGVILTAFAKSFTFYFISYGLITSFGFGLVLAAFSLAINSYFHKRRGRAIGIGMTITGIGPILMPLFLSYLLGEYGAQGTILIIGGISLHALVAASFLQPVKWHMKEVIPDVELLPIEENKEKELTENLIQNEKDCKNQSRDNIHEITGSTLSIDHDVDTQSIYGFDTPLPRRRVSQASIVYDGKHRKRNISRSESHPERQLTAVSVNSLNSLRSIAEDKIKESENNQYKNTITITKEDEDILEEPKKKQTFCSKVFYFFDLDLLKDPEYLNLMLGMSLAVCAEINFSLLTPFILDDFNLSTLQIAQAMSIIAASDIVFRFCAPFISDWLKIDCKLMYMISLVMLIMGRTALIFAKSSFTSIKIVAVALGIGKGFRTVYMTLLIPNYVPIEKLPSASGIQMVTNGIVNLISGPVLGAIRDFTGNYDKCIIIINSITFATLVMWTLQYIYMRIKKRR